MYRGVLIRTVVLSCVFLALFAIAAGATYAQTGSGASPPAAIDYKLGTGDKVHITVFGQTDLNGDYVVDGNGNVQLPLIGQIKAVGLTVSDFQKDLIARLSDGFFVNPSVSVDVVNYRPFYIMGEVDKPGEYPYVNGMSILNAVALAGGYTTRADDTEAYIRRNGTNKEVQVPADATSKVEPGDIIRIPERYF